MEKYVKITQKSKNSCNSIRKTGKEYKERKEQHEVKAKKRRGYSDMKTWNIIWQNLFLMSLGGAMYYCVELLYRGESHWSMFLLGGCCFEMIDVISERMTCLPNVWSKMLLSGAGITLLELICGCIVNLWLKLDVWDYSGMPLQVMGQICFIFSFFWFLLSFPAMKICKSLRVLFFE